MQDNTNRNRRLAILVVVLLILVGVGYFIYKQLTSYQTLAVKLSSEVVNPNIVITPIKNSGSAKEINYRPGTEVKLKKGEYNVNFNAEGYNQSDIEVRVGDNPATATITPSYTEAKLQELIAPQQAEITRVIQSQFPQTISKYKIEPGKLYLLGDWYATKIALRQTAQQERENYIDIYRVVLKKTGDSWEVVTKPPEITIGSPKYPNIPKEVLIDINKNPEEN